MVRRRPGPYSVGIERRARILDVASTLFATDGYHRTAMTRIAQDVGITDSGLLHYFATKRELLLAVAEHRIELAGTWFEQASQNPRESVLDEMVAATERFLAEPGLIELFVLVSAETVDTSSPAHAVFARRYEIAVKALAARFEVGVERGEFRRGLDCAQIARACIAVSDGLQLQWVISGKKLDLVAGVRAYCEQLRQAIGADT